MTAEEIYSHLDRAGLTPPVHYAAAPESWRMACAELANERVKVSINDANLRGALHEIEGAISEMETAKYTVRKMLERKANP